MAKKRAHDERASNMAADEAEDGGGRGMWSGTVSFGLVSIPVNLVPGVRHRRVALRMLHSAKPRGVFA